MGAVPDIAEAVVEALSDRVRYWITFNEPMCFLGLGYLLGMHAPFLKEPEAFPGCVKNMLLAHEKTVRMIREKAKMKPVIGFAMAAGTYIPDADDEAAVREAADGGVHDPMRVEFLNGFLANVKRAVDEGIPVPGYQHWSVMDNFEWCEGYGPRFGLIHVDYETQQRTIKDSGRRYAEIIRTNGSCLA